MSKLQVKPHEMKHRAFIKTVLRKRWPGMKDHSHCVYIGHDRGRVHLKAIGEWCEAQDGEWFYSTNWEKFYFSDPNTAFHFKIRWAGAPLTKTEQ